jgi:arylamine N-acetyltransferase
MVSRTAENERYALRENVLTVRYRDGSMEQQILSVSDLADCLTTTFNLPVTSDWRPVLQAAVAADGKSRVQETRSER